MPAKELKVGADGLTRARVNDLHDGDGRICITIDAGLNSLMVVLSRSDQQFLMMYLQERLK